MMKNTFKTISGVFIMAIALYSCSADTEETPVNALEQELQLENEGVLQLESTTYIFKKTGETSKFINEDPQFDFTFIDEINYVMEERESRHAVEGLVVTNPETQESISFNNFEELKNGKIRFDLELSNGQNFYGVTLNSKKGFTAEKWHQDPPRAVTSPLVGAVIEIAQEDVTGECVGALDVCARSGGRAAIAMKKGKGWFTAPENCHVSCNQ